MSRFYRPAAWVALVCYGLICAWLVIDPLPPPAVWTVITRVCSAALLVFCLSHATVMLGRGRALAFFVIAFTLTFSVEMLASSTGFLFGAYHYTERLGTKAFNLVPLLIPLAWFSALYTSRAVAAAIAPRAGWVGRSALGAAVMTSWDLMLDPMMVTRGHWVWHEPGQYYGIPLMNYVGWFVTSFLVLSVYRAYEVRRSEPTRVAVDARFAALPVVAQTTNWVASIVLAAACGERSAALIGGLSMGALVLVALWRTYRAAGEPSPAPVLEVFGKRVDEAVSP